MKEVIPALQEDVERAEDWVFGCVWQSNGSRRRTVREGATVP